MSTELTTERQEHRVNESLTENQSTAPEHIHLSRLRQKNQITVPESICKALGVEAGAYFTFVLVGENRCLLTLQRFQHESGMAKMIEAAAKERSEQSTDL